MKDALKDSALDTPAVQTTETLKTALCVILVSLAFLFAQEAGTAHRSESWGVAVHRGDVLAPLVGENRTAAGPRVTRKRTALIQKRHMRRNCDTTTRSSETLNSNYCGARHDKHEALKEAG